MTAVAKLEIPPEPIDFKTEMQMQLAQNYHLGKTIIKQATWLSPLWHLWKPELKPRAVRWQTFVEAARDCYGFFLDWIQNKMPWQQAVENLVKQIEFLRGLEAKYRGSPA